jgi:anti-anti-sigma factor
MSLKGDAMFMYHKINEDVFTMVLPEDDLGYDDCHALKNIISRHMGSGMLLSFNMGNVSFLDCAGIGFLVQMKNLTDKRNGSFEMRNLHKNVKHVLAGLTLNEFLNAS